ncbi:MAG: 50S ribosomal protein L35 [Sporolactobacillus sp.]
MPKMKTHKGAAKRFKKTGSGKFKRSQINSNHFKLHKSQKQTRNRRKAVIATPTLAKKIKKMINA